MTAARPLTEPTNVTAEKILDWASQAMRLQFLHLHRRGKTRGTATPEEFYGFRAEDVTEMYFHKHGEGPGGVWFRLKDGRVIDYRALPSQPEREWYITPAN